ncbi:unnamed protein product, partial [Mesorhabditis spiculigera]
MLDFNRLQGHIWKKIEGSGKDGAPGEPGQRGAQGMAGNMPKCAINVEEDCSQADVVRTQRAEDAVVLVQKAIVAHPDLQVHQASPDPTASRGRMARWASTGRRVLPVTWDIPALTVDLASRVAPVMMVHTVNVRHKRPRDNSPINCLPIVI